MKKIIQFLQKTFASLQSRSILPYELVAHYLAKSAKSISYVETFSKHADSLHKWIKQIYEEDLKQAFELQARDALRRLNIRYAELAFDFTKEPFYGKTNTPHTIGTSKKSHPYGAEFHFLTCCLINKGKQIPLMALPVRYGEQTKLTIEMIKYCQSLKFNIKSILFDRGFYRAEIIDYLNSQKLRYLILCPALDGILKEFRDNTEEFDSFIHQMHYTKAKSGWKPKVRITVCKNINDHDWIFAGNIQFNHSKDYVYLYKRRWQIETNYRVEDEAKIKSKSTNYLIRYFYFMISHLFHLLWIVHKNINSYVQFKRYIDIIENNLLFDFLNISHF
jgi:hypothetical protein